MRFRKLIGPVVGALAFSTTLVAQSSTARAADTVSGQMTFSCSMPDFGPSADFTYDAVMSVSAVREAPSSNSVHLAASMSDMPGVVPPFISMRDQAISVALGLTVNGEQVSLSASGRTDVNPSGGNVTPDPVVLPDDIRGHVTSTADDLAVRVQSFEFQVAGVGGTCEALSPEFGVVIPVTGFVEESVPQPEPSDQGAGSGRVVFQCSMPDFGPSADFAYDATVSVRAEREGVGAQKVHLAASMSDMPGVVPPFISMRDQQVSATLVLSADGQRVELSGSDKTDVNPTGDNGTKDPVKLPDPLQGVISTDADAVRLGATAFSFNVAGVGGACTATDVDLGVVVVGEGEPSTSVPEPLPDHGLLPGQPAVSTIAFRCVLGAPFNTPFDYVAEVAVGGAYASDGLGIGELLADFTPLPGLAPVPIQDGEMRAVVAGHVSGQQFTLTGNSTVNESARAPVQVPRLSGAVNIRNKPTNVTVESFHFEFDEIHGLVMSADCRVTQGGSLGPLVPGTDPTGAYTDPLNFTCRVPAFGRTVAYSTSAVVTATGQGNRVDSSLALGALPGIVPDRLAGVPMAASVHGRIGGRPATWTGTHELRIWSEVAIPVPPLSNSVTSFAKRADVVLERATFRVEHPDMDIVFDCSLPTPYTVQNVDVDRRMTVTVKRAPAARRAVVKVKVAGAQPTGRVTVTVAGGKDRRQRSVNLNAGGEAQWTLNQLAHVGQYSVESVYTGDSTNAPARRVFTFTMPKIRTATRVVKLQHVKKARNFKRIRVRARVNNPVPGQAKGQVRVVVKRGKKNIRVVRGVRLNKNGAVNRVIKGLGKQVNRKGQYRVVVQYQGTKRYQKSRVVQRFRLT